MATVVSSSHDSRRHFRPKLTQQDAMSSLELLEKRLSPRDRQGEALLRYLQSVRPLILLGVPNLSPLLPAFLSLKGQPYSLVNHFPFEPLFSTVMPRKFVLKAARQTSKSTSISAQGIIIAGCVPYFNTLYVTPLFEQIRRLSSNYVGGFLEDSPAKSLLLSRKVSNNVLQRGFVNKSKLFFSYAWLTPDRSRGIDADKLAIDECQDIDEQHLPIIAETMSGSPYGGISQFTGTPKTMENTLEGLWRDSSMGEWIIPCSNCKYENVPAVSHDLYQMMGPWREDISEHAPAVICRKCKRPIQPRLGRWVHRYPNLINDFKGLHIPQQIMPMHYADPDKWSVLLSKRDNITEHMFLNEVCGESSDQGFKLITLDELRYAAVLHENKLDSAIQLSRHYQTTKILAIDWGGGGENPLKTGQMFISYTVYAIMTLLPDGSIHVLFGHRSKTPHDPHREARMAIELAGQFGCQFIVHDYSGAGSLREKIVVDAGYPLDRLVPMWYVPTASQAAMRYVPGTRQHPRSHYKVDKARSLYYTCEAIRKGFIKFFLMDYVSRQDPGLLWDFLALVEDKVPTKAPRDLYRIIRSHNMSDDFAQAVNIGAWALWYKHHAFPNIAGGEKFRLDSEIEHELSQAPNWGD